MGASESTSRSNGTEEDDPQQENNRRSGGSSMGAGALATAAVVGVGVAAIGVSRLLSNNTNASTSRSKRTEEDDPQPENNGRPGGSSMGAGALATAWSHPRRGPYKMYTDGGCNLVHGDRGPGGYGGVLLDPDGMWVKGFRGYVSETYTLTVELISIQKGLELLDKHDLKGAILYNDNEEACKYAKEEGEYSGRSVIVRNSWHIIVECRNLAKNNGIAIKHIRREDNRHAHKLAKMAIANKQEYEEIEELPNELRLI